MLQPADALRRQRRERSDLHRAETSRCPFRAALHERGASGVAPACAAVSPTDSHGMPRTALARSQSSKGCLTSHICLTGTICRAIYVATRARHSRQVRPVDLSGDFVHVPAPEHSRCAHASPESADSGLGGSTRRPRPDTRERGALCCTCRRAVDDGPVRHAPGLRCDRPKPKSVSASPRPRASAGGAGLMLPVLPFPSLPGGVTSERCLPRGRYWCGVVSVCRVLHMPPV